MKKYYLITTKMKQFMEGGRGIYETEVYNAVTDKSPVQLLILQEQCTKQQKAKGSAYFIFYLLFAIEISEEDFAAAQKTGFERV